MTLVLETGLSVKGIEAIRKRLSAYVESMPEKAEELCRRLAEIGVDAAVANIDHDESGELRSSIRLERRDDKEYVVIADCDYAIYVEFGTGVVGAASTYAGERPDWVGAPGSRSSKVREDGSWVYFDEKQDRFRITSGQRPQAFMSTAAVEMRQQVLSIAKEVFSK